MSAQALIANIDAATIPPPRTGVEVAPGWHWFALDPAGRGRGEPLWWAAASRPGGPWSDTCREYLSVEGENYDDARRRLRAAIEERWTHA